MFIILLAMGRKRKYSNSTGGPKSIYFSQENLEFIESKGNASEYLNNVIDQQRRIESVTKKQHTLLNIPTLSQLPRLG